MNGHTRRRRPKPQRVGAYRQAPVYMTDNPNRGKHHTASATARVNSLTSAERDAINASRRSYVPLTVTTPLVRDALGRMLPKQRQTASAYTI